MTRLYQWLHEWASCLFNPSVRPGRVTKRRVVTVEREELLLLVRARVARHKPPDGDPQRPNDID